jgi:uncharacterized Ntn-hydrolase superfamily protein
MIRSRSMIGSSHGAIPSRGALAMLLVLLAAIGLSSGNLRLRSGAKPLVRRPLPSQVVATFSIVAFDPDARQWGVAVQSRVLAVGSIVPFAQSQVGAVATQSYANTTFGPRGLKLLSEGLSAKQVVTRLIDSDDDRDHRQLAVVDAQGETANYTGAKCLDWAGATSGKNYSCQGNILAGRSVVTDMGKAFEDAKGALAERLLASLEAGQKAGGDKRGMQSAAVLVVQKDAGYGGFDDRLIDLRVDDHESPIAELRRILDVRLDREKK